MLLLLLLLLLAIFPPPPPPPPLPGRGGRRGMPLGASVLEFVLLAAACGRCVGGAGRTTAAIGTVAMVADVVDDDGASARRGLLGELLWLLPLAASSSCSRLAFPVAATTNSAKLPEGRLDIASRDLASKATSLFFNSSTFSSALPVPLSRCWKRESAVVPTSLKYAQQVDSKCCRLEFTSSCMPAALLATTSVQASMWPILVELASTCPSRCSPKAPISRRAVSRIASRADCRRSPCCVRTS
mmetsp:Transcript_2543/g.5454  ORF Transcript_2543/g.5454 Transcript_2543/m.5454 type:complete len:243 (+) Transcript_2543:493-1221(+)